MKKYFYLLAAALLVIYTGQAQIKKGDVLIGGNLNFVKQDIDPLVPFQSNDHSINVYPSIGKAIADNLVLGVNFMYHHSNTKSSDGYNPLYTLEDNIYGTAFFIRRYKSLGHGFSVYVEGSLMGTRYVQKGTYQGFDVPYVDEKGYSVEASMNGGISYTIAPRWQLEAGWRDLFYAYYGSDKDDGYNTVNGSRKTTNFILGSGLSNTLNSISLGCRFILN